eukprot:scaffold12153_cov167-Amphora_coffeaeformis.AAC.1
MSPFSNKGWWSRHLASTSRRPHSHLKDEHPVLSCPVLLFSSLDGLARRIVFFSGGGGGGGGEET